MMKLVSLSKVHDVTDESVSFSIYENNSRYNCKINITKKKRHDVLNCIKTGFGVTITFRSFLYDHVIFVRLPSGSRVFKNTRVKSSFKSLKHCI